MNPFEWSQATSLEGAQQQLTKDGNVVLKAGGVDLLDLLKERLITPQRLVDLQAVPGLNQIDYDPTKGLTIGPMVTLSQLAEHSLVKKLTPCLAEAAGLIATPQIRNMATLGGNLCQRPRCWYFRSEDFKCFKKGGTQCFAQDGENANHAVFGNNLCAMVHPSGTATALLALKASVTVLSPPKKQSPTSRLLKKTPKPDLRQVALKDFFTPPETHPLRENILGPQDVITQIHIPPRSARAKGVYIKQKQKQSFDWPLAEVAVSAEIDNGRCQRLRVILGAVAPVPWRAKSVEDSLTGKPLDDQHIRQAAKAVRRGARPLAQNAYKLDLTEALLVRAFQELMKN